MEGSSRAAAVADQVATRMSQSFLSPKALLSKMSILDDPIRTSSVYHDPNYLPFYFHLGRVLKPRSIFCLGAELGLQVGCLLEGCQDPQRVVCLQPPSEDTYSSRIAVSNIKFVAGKHFPISLGIGTINDDAAAAIKGYRFDLAMIVVSMPVDDLMESMDFCWSLLGDDGLMVVDMLDDRNAGVVFEDFCKGRSIDHRTLKTRYGTGIASR